MTWFAFKGYKTIDVAGIQEKNLVAWGFHGYGTKAQAERHPNTVNVFQKLIVNSAELDYAYASKTGETPGGANANPNRWPGADVASGVAGEIEQGIAKGFGDFFTAIWNVIKGPILIIAGGFVLVIGLVFFFKNDIMSVAGAAAKVAM